jgi:hypothetical protein
MIMTSDGQGISSGRDARDLFTAHLEVLVHLLRDDLRWSHPDDLRDRSPIFRVLRRERRRLLDFQGGELEREARFRVVQDRRVGLLEDQLGLEPRDALAVAWFFEVDIVEAGSAAALINGNRPAATEAVIRRIGSAHGRLLEGDESFIPRPGDTSAHGFAMAAAVAATRVARAHGDSVTWIEVEPVARRIVETLAEASSSEDPEVAGVHSTATS